MANILWSDEQQAVFALQDKPGGGNICVRARAGTGKTTVAKGMLERIPAHQAAVYLAFNKDIVGDIQRDLADPENQFDIRCKLEISTFHKHFLLAIYRSAVGRHAKIVDRGKEDQKKWAIKSVIEQGGMGVEKQEVPQHLVSTVHSLFDIARFNGYGYTRPGDSAATARKFTREEWVGFIKRYNADEYLPGAYKLPGCSAEDAAVVVDEVIRLTELYLRIGYRMLSLIDFEDMLWLPLVNPDIRQAIPRYHWVFVDEAQDMNFVRRELIQYLLRPAARPAERGRLVIVGDDRQSIYGFSGADFDSLDRAKSQYHCTELPLYTTRRCGQAIVKTAQQWVPSFTAAVGTHQGAVYGPVDKTVDEFDLNPQTDMVLCRNNRPLVQVFFQLLKAGTPAIILGNDLAKKMIRLINDCIDELDLSEEIRMGKFRDTFQAWLQGKVSQMEDEGKPGLAGYLQDMGGGVLVVVDQQSTRGTLRDLYRAIEGMFMSQDGKRVDRVVLSSIHKSKGRESDRVFWVGANLYQPSKYAKTPEDLVQEENLMYVAATRAKRELYMLNMEKGKYD